MTKQEQELLQLTKSIASVLKNEVRNEEYLENLISDLRKTLSVEVVAEKKTLAILTRSFKSSSLKKIYFT